MGHRGRGWVIKVGGGEGTGTWEQFGGYVSTRELMKATYCPVHY